jgi:hypothetical protein
MNMPTNCSISSIQASWKPWFGCMTEPVTASIGNAPIDDEPVTDEEKRAVAASKEWFKRNGGIPFEEVADELGLTMEQFRRHDH